jgi:pSer/pThr/pTyr-binding forkhead associated (FHA) protein
MSARVVLIAISGPFDGRQFIFTGKKQVLLGRSQSCGVQVSGLDYRASRQHCELDIDAPSVSIRDLGSLNGTYVNGVLIGRREHQADPETTATLVEPTYPLENGDTIRIGDSMFRVEIISTAEKAGVNEEMIAVS